MKLILTLIVSALSTSLIPLSLASTLDGSSAFLGNTGFDSSAVDSKGVRHRTTDYPGAISSWLNDRIQAFAPDYPYADRVQRGEGTGLFRLVFDLKTGDVTEIVIVEVNGICHVHSLRDNLLSTVALETRQMERIDMPIKFTMHDNSSPPKSAQLPRRE